MASASYPEFSPEFFMTQALSLAKEAAEQGDVPVGCVVVQKNQIVGRGKNCRELNSDATAHAEILAISQACDHLKRWRLADCSLYVTLEPCAMCTGAILNSKISAVYFGAWEEKTGCCGTRLNLSMEGLGHRPRIYGGVLAQESKVLLDDFFQTLRK